MRKKEQRRLARIAAFVLAFPLLFLIASAVGVDPPPWSNTVDRVFPFLAGVHQRPWDPVYNDPFPANLFLVRAKAVSVSNRPLGEFGAKRERACFVIEHVYVGPARLRGWTFTLEVTRGMSHLYIGPPESDALVKEGEVGVWWITPFPDGKLNYIHSSFLHVLAPPTSHPIVHGSPWTSGAGRDSVEGNAFQKWLAWGDWLEKIYTAQGKKRFDLLKQSCRSKDVMTSAVAFTLLHACRPEAALDFFERLSTEENVSLTQEFQIEGKLSGYRKGTWHNSRVRWKKLRGWMTRTLEEGKAGRDLEIGIEHRLSGMLMDDNLDYWSFLELAVLGLANPARSEAFKTRLLEMTTCKVWFDRQVADEFLTERLAVLREGTERSACLRIRQQLPP